MLGKKERAWRFLLVELHERYSGHKQEERQELHLAQLALFALTRYYNKCVIIITNMCYYYTWLSLRCSLLHVIVTNVLSL